MGFGGMFRYRGLKPGVFVTVAMPAKKFGGRGHFSSRRRVVARCLISFFTAMGRGFFSR